MVAGETSGAEMSSINVTPLTDVLLVLLITFLLTAPAFETPRAELPLPQVTSLHALEDSMEILILVDGVDSPGGSGRLTADQVDRETLAHLREKSTHQVLGLAIERSVPYGDLYRVVQEAEAAGWTSLVLLTEPKKP